MYSDLELEAFNIVDTLLSELRTRHNGGNFMPNSFGNAGHIAKGILEEHSLISYRNPSARFSIIDIAPAGLKVLEVKGIQNYLDAITKKKEEKEALEHSLNTEELRKVKLEVDHLVETLVDYPKNKARTIRSERIAAFAALLSLLTLMSQWLCNKPS